MTKKYRKKPVVIDAMEYTGENDLAIATWTNEVVVTSPNVGENGVVVNTLLIKTLEGVMKASPGDFIIKGVQGEFYPCKPEIFRATYEEV